jgi:hypothetical protein
VPYSQVVNVLLLLLHIGDRECVLVMLDDSVGLTPEFVGMLETLALSTIGGTVSMARGMSVVPADMEETVGGVCVASVASGIGMGAEADAISIPALENSISN